MDTSPLVAMLIRHNQHCKCCFLGVPCEQAEHMLDEWIDRLINAPEESVVVCAQSGFEGMKHAA